MTHCHRTTPLQLAAAYVLALAGKAGKASSGYSTTVAHKHRKPDSIRRANRVATCTPCHASLLVPLAAGNEHPATRQIR
jgi:hypothetical protein